MNRIQCTGIIYEDGTKKIMYHIDDVADSTNISMISYPMLTNEEIEEIKSATIDKLHKLLSNYF